MLSHFLFSVGIFMLASSSQVLVDAFTLSSTNISSRLRSTSIKGRVSTTSTAVEMVAVCDMIESSTLVKEDTPVVTSSTAIQERSSIRHADKSSELNHDDESYEMWTLMLFDDESNTRSYICRCLVQDAHLFEEDSYRKMMQAHKHGEAIIGEYCQEHAEYYKDALTNSGLVCDIFPVEQ